MAEHRRVEPSVVLQHVAAALIVVDRAGTLVYANDVVAAMAGTSPDELVGKPFNFGEWRARDRSGRLLEVEEYPVARGLSGEQVMGAELVVDRPDGESLVLLATAMPLFDVDGDVDLVVTTVQDVTDTLEHERSLQSTRARLAAVFDNASEGIVLADDDGRYVAVNRAAARMLGYEVEQLLAMEIADVLAPPSDAHAMYGEFLESGEDAREVALVRSDGDLVLVEAAAVANVEPGLHLSVWRDVSERHRMQLELVNTRARLETVVSGSPVGLLLADRDDVVLVANPAACAMLRSEEAVGASLTQLFGAALAGGYEQWLADAARVGEVSLETVDGRVLEARVESVGGSGERLIHLLDITERAATEAARRDALQRERDAAADQYRLNQMKDTFLSAVSHELRTPLSVLVGALETIRDRGDVLSPDQRRDFDARMLTNAHRLHGLLDELLDLSRLQSGSMTVLNSQVSLRDLVEGAVESVPIDGHDVTLDVTDDVLSLDRAKFERILVNLVANAARHTPPGTRVEVRTSVADGVLVLEVEDDGPGLPTELRGRAFGMFVKGMTGHAGAVGTGIGLALVREFARLMGGEAQVCSGQLGGACFQVTLPVDTEPGPPGEGTAS